MPKSVPLEKWIGTELKRIESFVRFWTKSNKTDPGKHPLKLSKKEWEEQFKNWIVK